MLRYSREIAFAAAEVYAHAAEARGAWDARLESLVVDAVVRGEADESIQSRAAALGWGSTSQVTVIVGTTPPGSPALVVEAVHRAGRRIGVEILVAIHGRRLVCIAGPVDDEIRGGRRAGPRPRRGADRRRDRSSPTCSPPDAAPGPRCPGHTAAPGLARRAPAGARRRPPRRARAPRRPARPQRPLRPDLRARCATARAEALLATAAAFLDGGLGVEGTARALFVHANTVRYRLTSIAKLTGYDLADPHDAQTVRVALAYGGWPRSD